MADPNKAPSADMIARRREALEMRKRGANYREIAAALGVGLTTAHRYVTAELDELRAETRASAEQLRDLELERLDQYLARLQPKIEDGDEKAIATALRVQERRAKLTGLDAPQRTEVTIGGESAIDRLREVVGGDS